MRTRPAPLARILDLPAPSKALLSSASHAVAFPLHQAERVVKRLRGAAAAGLNAGVQAVTGVLDALASARREAPTSSQPVPPMQAPAVPPHAARTVPPPAPPAPRVPAVPPHAADLLPADVPAGQNGATPPSELHRPGEDPFPIKHYDTLTVADVLVALRALQRQADVAAVARHEVANRNRKSIATAAQTRIAQLDRLDVRT
jgi:hypothetical protein